MRVDFTRLSPFDAFKHLICSLPIHYIEFLKLNTFIDDEGLAVMSVFKESLVELGENRCHHCSYPKSPLATLSGVKLSGAKGDEKLLKKLPPAEHLVPQFAYYKSCNVAQLQGVMPLCNDCYSVYISMIAKLADEKPFTESRVWSNLIVPTFQKEYDVETTELAKWAEEHVESYLGVVERGVCWDLTYLYNRGIVDERLIHTPSAAKRADLEKQEGGESPSDNTSSGKGNTKTAEQAKEAFQKGIDKNKREQALNAAGKLADQRALDLMKQSKDVVGGSWQGLNSHLAEQNDEVNVAAKFADGAYDEPEAMDAEPDYSQSTTLRTVSDDSTDERTDERTDGDADEAGADESDTGEVEDDSSEQSGGVPGGEADDFSIDEQIRQEARQDSDENDNKKDGVGSSGMFTSKKQIPDDRGVPGFGSKDES